MARKAVVDKDVILSMLREGETTLRISEKFNVSRQAIDLHRKNFIEKGLLDNQRATKIRKALKKAVTQNQKSNTLRYPSTAKNMVSLDEQIDIIIDAFNALKRLPQLEKEVETYKHKYEDALLEIERLNENEKKRLDQESRWRLTQSDNNN